MTDEIRLEIVGYSGNSRNQSLEYEIEVLGILRGDPQKEYRTLYGMFISIADMQRLTEEFRKLQGSSGGGRGSGSYNGYNSIKVKATDIGLVSVIEAAIHDLGFPSTYSLEAQRKSAQETIQRTQMIFGGLGAMALIVAAISIANTMVTSVYERTREIGVMKVLGCLVGNIRAIFLVEASMIGFFGGVAGLVLSFMISFLMNMFSAAVSQGLGGITGGGFFMSPDAKISIIPMWLVLVSLAFATLIGLISGFLPANRAVKISALEAIKQE
jgi:ABC-type antimicrobial peptide transport system permease subunit